MLGLQAFDTMSGLGIIFLYQGFEDPGKTLYFLSWLSGKNMDVFYMDVRMPQKFS
jgi:hypothetical protein